MKRALFEFSAENVNPVPEQLVRYTIEHELGHIFGVVHLEELLDANKQSKIDCSLILNDPGINCRKYLMCGEDRSTNFLKGIATGDPIVPPYYLPLTPLEEEEVWKLCSPRSFDTKPA